MLKPTKISQAIMYNALNTREFVFDIPLYDYECCGKYNKYLLFVNKYIHLFKKNHVIQLLPLVHLLLSRLLKPENEWDRLIRHQISLRT